MKSLLEMLEMYIVDYTSLYHKKIESDPSCLQCFFFKDNRGRLTPSNLPSGPTQSTSQAPPHTSSPCLQKLKKP
jgi:hypothetical protein